MSTKIKFKWKPGQLESVLVRKVENGFAVRVGVWGNCYDYAFRDFPDALQLLSECLCWDVAPEKASVAEAAAAEPAPQGFPATFQRFNVEGAEVRAVFVESGIELSRNDAEMERRIHSLKHAVGLTGGELAQWDAVLAELRATAASVAKAAD